MTLSMVTDVLPHMVDALRTANVSERPYSHFCAANIFPPEIYTSLLENLPDSHRYQPIHGQQHPRNYFQLDGEGLLTLPERARELWTSVVDALMSKEFKDQVFRLLKRDLQFRFRTRELESIEASPRPRLIRDTAGYKIEPHPDTRKKVVTMLIYLPHDDSQEDLGTSLYEIQPSWKGLSSKRGWFREVKRIPFRPNSAFAFVVNNCMRKKSWHGREEISADAGVRNSLEATLYRPGTVEYHRYA